MRMVSPGFFRLMVSAKKIGCHAAKLMVLPVEVGLVYREGIDQMFDLMLEIRAQHREISLK